MDSNQTALQHNHEANRRNEHTQRVNRWLANMKPNERQLIQLKTLGYRQEVSSQLEAVRLIAELSNQNGGRK